MDINLEEVTKPFQGAYTSTVWKSKKLDFRNFNMLWHERDQYPRIIRCTVIHSCTVMDFCKYYLIHLF